MYLYIHIYHIAIYYTCATTNTHAPPPWLGLESARTAWRPPSLGLGAPRLSKACFNVAKTMPCLPSPSHHDFYVVSRKTITFPGKWEVFMIDYPHSINYIVLLK